MIRAKLAVTAAAVALGTGLWAGAAQADITIALAGPMTGAAAAYGEQTRAGVEAAVADINAKGGLLGQKLVLTIADDACDAKQAVAAANKLVGQNVAAVIGHVCSGASIAASNVYGEEGIVMISPTATSPQLTDRGLKNVFRVCGRDDQQGEVAARLIADRYKGKKVAIVHDKQAYGQGLADDVKRRLNAAGITETAFTSITAGEKDYSALITRLKSEGVEVLYYGGYDQELGLIARQSADQQFRPQIIGADGIQPQSYWNIAGETAEGTLFTFSPDPQRNPAAKPVVEAMQAKNIRTDGFTLFAYAAVQTYAQAVQKANSAKSADVQKALRAGPSFDTVVGSLSFDDKGDLKQPGYVFWAWKNGEKVQVD
ncbi:ABC transporter substrate-binding protein [Roseomonas genomospecies 6]|uniref:Branched-chain amino acid ABC transporter substrate-binding protein n=1 Tax=Roseomonas genomospecies 6 TaxID=214106 RepID=A0A9W7NM59_9PROT|nr:ABC transporter substrate-binding protein [Roseomonas genomospecies 6]KAA0682792.1 branched-chain amino acid ABC transporter substrate-binding protein [Roseomonas genomospecies 6]